MANNIDTHEELLVLRKKLHHPHNIENGLCLEKQIRQLEKQVEEYELDTDQKFLTLSTLAYYYRNINNYDKSASFSHRAIRLTKEVSIDYVEVIIETYLEYAALERHYKHYANVRIELAKILVYLEKQKITHPAFYGEIYYSLGITSIAEGNIEIAINQLQSARKYFQQKLPIIHRKTIQTIHALSDAYLHGEHYQEALELYQLLREAYHDNESKVMEARTLLKIGEIEFYINLKDARKTITHAIKVLNDTNRATAYDFMQGNLMLAEIDEHIGNYPRAITYYKRAIEQEQLDSENQFLIMYIYSKLGMISTRINELDKARSYLEHALQLSADFSSMRVPFLYALAEIYARKNLHEKLLSIFEEIQTYEKNENKLSITYANLLQTLGLSFAKKKKFEDAITYYEEALLIYRNFSNSKEENGLTFIRLAYCYEYKKEKELDKAEECYEKGVTILKKARNKELLREALEEIVGFYSRNPNEANRNLYAIKLLNL